ALRIVDGELETLARHDIPLMARRLSVDTQSIADACALVRQLNPHPGAAMSAGPVEYIVPDAYVRRVDGQWRVSLSPQSQPCLSLNRQYCQLLHEVGQRDAAWMRGQLQEARWLMRSLQTRADTILKVAQVIV